jgi:hypothetical protein
MSILGTEFTCVIFGSKYLVLLLEAAIFGTKFTCVSISNCPFLVHKSLVLLYETVTFGTKVTCVTFSTKFTGVIPGNSLCLLPKISVLQS